MEGRASNSWSWSQGGKEDSTQRLREISEREVCSEAEVGLEEVLGVVELEELEVEIEVAVPERI